MNSEEILEGISFIDSNFIENSAAVLKRRRFGGIAKIAASVAAALVLVFGGYDAVYNAAINNITSDNEVPPAAVAEIDGAGYCRESFHTGDIREAFGLPKPTDKLKGAFVGSYYARFDGDTGGSVDFYEIKGRIDRRIILGEYKDELSYWIMVCGGESFETVRERLEYYGYGSVEDVHTMRVDNREIKDREKISEVWNALLNGTEITEEEYVRLFQGEDYDEANAEKVYTRHSRSHRLIGFNYGEPTYVLFGYYTDINCFNGFGYIVSPSPIDFR